MAPVALRPESEANSKCSPPKRARNSTTASAWETWRPPRACRWRSTTTSVWRRSLSQTRSTTQCSRPWGCAPVRVTRRRPCPTLKLPHRHAPRVHPDDLFVEALKALLPLGHQARLEGALPVPRDGDLHLPPSRSGNADVSPARTSISLRTARLEAGLFVAEERIEPARRRRSQRGVPDTTSLNKQSVRAIQPTSLRSLVSARCGNMIWSPGVASAQ